MFFCLDPEEGAEKGDEPRRRRRQQPHSKGNVSKKNGRNDGLLLRL
jgi:hypothetical protein